MGIYESRIEQCRKDIVRLRERAARASSTIADERKKAADYRARATRSSSPAQYVRQADSAEDRANKAERERASIDKEIARKEKQLYDAQATLDRERARADQQRARALEARLRDIHQPPPMATWAAPAQAAGSTREWDFFISYASPDKDEFVRPLAAALQERGARVWFDEFELRVGDSIRAKIDQGLARSRFGVVVLTRAYLAGRRWTENELNGLFAAEKPVLPIWHNVSYDDVARYSPMVADRKGLNTALEPLSEIVDRLVSLLDDPDEQGREAG